MVAAGAARRSVWNALHLESHCYENITTDAWNRRQTIKSALLAFLRGFQTFCVAAEWEVVNPPDGHNALPSAQVAAKMRAGCRVRTTAASGHRAFLLPLVFLEFHADAHEKAGLRGIVGQAVLYVIHVEITVACLQENIPREIDTN